MLFYWVVLKVKRALETIVFVIFNSDEVKSTDWFFLEFNAFESFYHFDSAFHYESKREAMNQEEETKTDDVSVDGAGMEEEAEGKIGK